MKSQRGFGLLEGLLIIVIIGLIAGAGWYVWDSKKNADKSLTNASISDSVTADLQPGDKQSIENLTKDWKAYSSQEGQYSFKHPASWVYAPNADVCAEGLVLLGANASAVGTCASENGGQMLVSSQNGDLRSQYELKSSNYPDLKAENVTVDGVAGKKQSGTFKADPNAEGSGPADGDKVVAYIFYANGRTYQANYWIKTSFPDVLKDFETMVTKTLKFQP